jgi:DNA-binding transcriptional ArsR family regulator
VGVPLYQAKAEFFKTLGHPARIRILELLSERDHSVHDLLESIDIEPSNLSQQLSILRRSSLVASHRRAGEVRYSASAPGVRELLLVVREVLDGMTRVDHEASHSPAPRSTPTPTQGRPQRR